MIFEVECDTTKRTHGPDAHTYCLFYCIRLHTRYPTILKFTFPLSLQKVLRCGSVGCCSPPASAGWLMKETRSSSPQSCVRSCQSSGHFPSPVNRWLATPDTTATSWIVTLLETNIIGTITYHYHWNCSWNREQELKHISIRLKVPAD